MAEAVAEVLAVAGRVDDRRARPRRPRGPSGPGRTAASAASWARSTSVVDLASRGSTSLAGRERARAVRAVAVELRAPVDRHERARAGSRRRAARRAAARRARRAATIGGNDDRLGAQRRIVELEVERDLALGAAREPARPARSASASSASSAAARMRVDLVGVLDGAQPLDQPRRPATSSTPSRSSRAELARGRATRQVRVVEAEPQRRPRRAAPGDAPRAGRCDDLARPRRRRAARRTA